MQETEHFKETIINIIEEIKDSEPMKKEQNALVLKQKHKSS